MKTIAGKFATLDPWEKAFCLFLGVHILLILATFCDYGLSYDEFQHNMLMGNAILRFFLTLGGDLTSTTTMNYYLYGGLFDAPAIVLVRLLPFNIADSHHLAIALAGLTGVIGCYLTARLAGGAQAGFWAALFLVSCAPWYGHSFINPKDIPFATAYIWGVYAILRVVRELPSPPLRLRLLLGLTVGAAMGVRIVGVALFLFLMILALADLASSYARRRDGATTLARLAALAVALAPSMLLAWAVAIALWPAALLSPISMPFRALTEFSHFSHNFLTLWRGQWLWSNNVPASYLPVLFGVELPEYLLVLILAALPWSFAQLWRNVKNGNTVEGSKYFLLICAALFPPAYAIISRANIYDNARQFLFILPPLACLLGLVCARWLDCTGKASVWGRRALIALLTSFIALQAARMAQLHPYEYTFKNLLAGGMPEAGDRYETDYWITSFREAAEKMVEHARAVAAREGVEFGSRRFTVAVNERPLNVSGFLPANFTAVNYRSPELFTKKSPSAEEIGKVFAFDNPGTDYVISTTHLNMHKMSPAWTVVETVGRVGMTFAVVKASPEIAGRD